MPHQCTACGRRFDDGSKEMLSGCPDCGGTKFQFLPDGGQVVDEVPPEPPEREGSPVAETVGHATAKLRDFVGDERGPSPAGGDDEVGVDDERTGTAAGGEVEEDGAQSSARSEMVRPDELPDAPPGAGAGAPTADAGSPNGSRDATLPGRVGDDDGAARVVDTPSGERPDLAELREELNDQFEGIRIREPGQYELNLMELYEREETIIALQENGRYVIEPPESWHGDGSE